MTPKEQLIESLRILCDREGGYVAVADEVGVNDQTLWQVLAGIKLPSGEPRGIGPAVQKKLEHRYPGWSLLARTRQADAKVAHPVSQSSSNIPSDQREGNVSTSEPAEGYVRLPILAEASAGPGIAPDTTELIEHVDVAEEWVRRTLKASPGNVRVLTARGHSMSGLIEDGDAMFVVPCTEFINDGLYVISVDGLLRVKRLRATVVTKLLSIESNDGSPPETIPLSTVDETLRICGRVIGSWSLKRF